MLEKTLALTDVMFAAYKSFMDPLNEKLAADVSDYIGKMVVLQYLPLRDKQVSIFRILNLLQANEDKNPEEVNTQMELLFMLEVINQYTNIEVESGFYELFNEDFYDALMATGIIEAIEDICLDDISRLRNMLESTMNWRNMFSLVDRFGDIDMTHVDALVDEVKSVKDSLKEENIDLLKRIVDYNQPNVRNFSDVISASIVNSLDKVSEEQLSQWHEKHDVFVDLDNLLGEQSYNQILNNIEEYFNQHPELGHVEEHEIKNVYDYLKEKNQNEINKIDYQITEENKKNIESGISAQMIKLLSKKKALEAKYKKEEELLRLADNIMTMDSAEIDEIAKVFKTINNDKKEKENNKN